MAAGVLHRGDGLPAYPRTSRSANAQRAHQGLPTNCKLSCQLVVRALGGRASAHSSPLRGQRTWRRRMDRHITGRMLPRRRPGAAAELVLLRAGSRIPFDDRGRYPDGADILGWRSVNPASESCCEGGWPCRNDIQLRSGCPMRARLVVCDARNVVHPRHAAHSGRRI